MKTTQTVDEYILGQNTRQKELIELREILKSTGMTETVKWGVPVYTIEGKNIAGLAAFKSYVAIWFYQGSLLKDKKKKLINAQEGTTKALRQWRFSSFDEIDSKTIIAYVHEAIENEKKGFKITPTAKPMLQIPSELKEVLNENKELSLHFENLSPFKQREFIEYLLEAKKEETRQKRLDKIIQIIIDGHGLNDNYR